MNLILFDDIEIAENLKPLCWTRPIGDLRCGIFTINEKWEKRLHTKVSYLTQNYLSGKFPVSYGEDNWYVNASVLPNIDLIKTIRQLQFGEALVQNDVLIAYRSEEKIAFPLSIPENTHKVEYSEKISQIKQMPDLFLLNGQEILADFEMIDWGNSGENPDQHTIVYNPENVYWGKNVNVKAAILNAEAGPIYIGDNAIIKEGAVIVGPTVVGNNAMVGLGANIREFTTIGPFCRVAGEVKNVTFHSYSNKAHEGFLGNGYVGVACNLGAGTNASNLKNNLKSVEIYSYLQGDFYDTGEKHCGSFIGDYAKTGISTMLNTGTVIGVAANVFGAGYQSKFIPDFSWGGRAEGYSKYIFDKAIEAINATLDGFKKQLSEEEIEILKHIADQ